MDEDGQEVSRSKVLYRHDSGVVGNGLLEERMCLVNGVTRGCAKTLYG